MEYSELKDKIIVHLEKIVERNNFLNKKDENISLIELDILMQDMRDLYDIYAQIKKKIEEKDHVSKPEIKREAVVREEPSRPQPEEVKVEEKIIEEVKPEPEKMPDNTSKATIQEVVPETPSKPENNNKASVGDKYEDEKQPIGEKLVSIESSVHDKIVVNKEDNSIGARLQQKSINSLKDAIGVNEKFLFINELFNGNIQAYNEAVEKLNNFKDINEAFEYINILTTDFSWDGNRSASTIEKFASLVQRRYMSN